MALPRRTLAPVAGWPEFLQMNSEPSDRWPKSEDTPSWGYFVEESLNFFRIQPTVLGIFRKGVLLFQKRIFVGLNQITLSYI